MAPALDVICPNDMLCSSKRKLSVTVDSWTSMIVTTAAQQVTNFIELIVLHNGYTFVTTIVHVSPPQNLTVPDMCTTPSATWRRIHLAGLYLMTGQQLPNGKHNAYQGIAVRCDEPSNHAITYRQALFCQGSPGYLYHAASSQGGTT